MSETIEELDIPKAKDEHIFRNEKLINSDFLASPSELSMLFLVLFTLKLKLASLKHELCTFLPKL
ncbi:hypothetical protein [Marinifilum sp.]|uniref:hypothetical protein n=1 Tax=Marinifilum sp. TaxID=2033137 RepID=UPI003BA98111